MTTTTLRLACPRCEGALSAQRDQYGAYWQCFRCGHHSYPNVPSEPHQTPSVSRMACRYVGEGHGWAVEEPIWYRYGGPRGKTVIPSCLFCGVDMVDFNRSGTRKKRGDHGYVCASGHSITLVLGPKGVEGWR